MGWPSSGSSAAEDSNCTINSFGFLDQSLDELPENGKTRRLQYEIEQMVSPTLRTSYAQDFDL